MKLSAQTGNLCKKVGIKKVVNLLIDAGFDAIDFTFPEFGYETFPEDKEFYVELRKYVENQGKSFNQSHAPAPSSFLDEERTNKMFAVIVSTMRRASYLGVKTIVVHPCQHLLYVEKDVPEKLFEYNMNFYRRLIPYCEEYGIKVAVENMWQYPRMISHSTCSRVQEFIRYLDELHSDYIVGCLDIGHAMLVREMPHEFIRALGNKRLQCLHVHDVDGIEDLHTVPYFGIVDWDSVMKALAEIEYKGDFTFEADAFLEDKPENLIPQYLKVMEQTGRYLIHKFEDYKC